MTWLDAIEYDKNMMTTAYVILVRWLVGRRNRLSIHHPPLELGGKILLYFEILK